MIALLLLAACDPYRTWPDEGTAFPDVYTPETDLEPYEEVRWETETWDPLTDTQSAALYLLKAAQHRKGAPDESLDHFDAMREKVPPVADGLTLSFAGDAMWIPDNHTAFATDIAALLDGDLRIGNLETPTSANFPTELGALGLYAFNSPPALLDGMPLDVLQVNNNHSLDAGEQGLTDTLAEIAARGKVATGVDTHAVVEVEGTEIAFLTYTWGINQRDVVPERELFIVPFGHIDEDIDLSGIADDIAAQRADGVDLVVVMVHWGFEYEYYPDPHFLVMGRQIVAAGADLVVGQGPHVVQPPEVCQVNLPEIVPGVGTCSVRTEDGVPRTAAILYSLGDFESIVATEPCRVGIVATVSFDEGGVSGLGWTPVANLTDGLHHMVPLDTLLDDPDFSAESIRLDSHLGSDWRRTEAR